MCHTVKLPVVDDSCAHVKRGAFLFPFLSDDPFALFNMRMNASRATVFAAHQNVPVVDRGSRHVLIRSPVRQVVLPEELAGLYFDSKQVFVVPFDNGQLQIIEAKGAESRKVEEYKVADRSTWAAPVLLKDGILIKDRQELIRWSFTKTK